MNRMAAGGKEDRLLWRVKHCLHQGVGITGMAEVVQRFMVAFQSADNAFVLLLLLLWRLLFFVVILTHDFLLLVLQVLQLLLFPHLGFLFFLLLRMKIAWMGSVLSSPDSLFVISNYLFVAAIQGIPQPLISSNLLKGSFDSLKFGFQVDCDQHLNIVIQKTLKGRGYFLLKMESIGIHDASACFNDLLHLLLLRAKP